MALVRLHLENRPLLQALVPRPCGWGEGNCDSFVAGGNDLGGEIKELNGLAFLLNTGPLRVERPGGWSTVRGLWVFVVEGPTRSGPTVPVPLHVPPSPLFMFLSPVWILSFSDFAKSFLHLGFCIYISFFLAAASCHPFSISATMSLSQ